MIVNKIRGISSALGSLISKRNAVSRNFGSASIHTQNRDIWGSSQRSEEQALEVDWFPMKVSDLNLIGNKLMVVGQGPNSTHPSYTDKEYRKRRDYIGRLGIGHKMGDPIKRANYTASENKLWQHIYTSVRPLHEEVYCDQYLQAIRDLERLGIFRPDRIPELDDLDSWLSQVSDWRTKPVGGILTQREFLNCLAFKTFCSGQFLRHPAQPEYTPEPDIMHEYVGHIPSFANRQICDLSQRLGELSLGATDAQVAEIGTIYWYTIEFGLCIQNQDVKVYGAGPAGSVAEMKRIQERVRNNRNSLRKLDIMKNDMPQEIEDEDLQSIFYTAASYDDFISQIEAYTSRFERKFHLRFDKRTSSYTCDKELKFLNSPVLINSAN